MEISENLERKNFLNSIKDIFKTYREYPSHGERLSSQWDQIKQNSISRILNVTMKQDRNSAWSVRENIVCFRSHNLRFVNSVGLNSRKNLILALCIYNFYLNVVPSSPLSPVFPTLE